MVAYLDEAAMRKALDWDALIAAMETALASYSAGKVIQPVRNTLTIEEGKRYLGIMPAVTEDAMGAKLVSFYPGNAGSSHPTHMAMIALFRPDTGEPLAAMDGRLITEMRTAAVSAAVTRSLAPPDSRILALLGSGVQAEAHLEALEAGAQVHRRAGLEPDAGERPALRRGAWRRRDAGSARRRSRAPTSSSPRPAPWRRYCSARGSSRGAHVNAVGAARPNWRELDDEAMRSGALIVDSREAALAESGDVILSKAPIFAEAGEIFAGAAKPPAGTTTIFKSLGLAVEDIAAARLVYKAAIG